MADDNGFPNNDVESGEETGNSTQEFTNNTSGNQASTSTSGSSGGILVSLAAAGMSTSFNVPFNSFGGSLMGTDWSSFVKNYDGCAMPVGSLYIGGSKWKSDTAFFSSFDMEASVWGEASICNITIKTLKNGSNKKLELSKDLTKIKAGEKVKVCLGYLVSGKEKSDVVFEGYISSLEINVDEQANQEAIIQATDGKIWMMSSRSTELKKDKKKYSDAASDTIKGYKSKFKSTKISVSGESQTETAIYQNGESDFEFVKNMSERIGALFYVDRGKLNLTDVKSNSSSEYSIGTDQGIRKLSVSVNMWGIPKKVTVIGSNSKDIEKPIKGSATSGESIGSGTDAGKITSNLGGENEVIIYDNSISSKEEAKARAEAYFTLKALKLVEGKIESVGNHSICLGSGVKLTGYGKPIDNSYIVTKIKHMANFNDHTFDSEIYINASKYNSGSSLF